MAPKLCLRLQILHRPHIKRQWTSSRQDLGISADENIPYVNQIVVLAEIFRLLPKPTAQQRLAIRQWFWRTAISGYFGGWNTGNMAADQDAVRRFAGGETLDIADTTRDPGQSVWLSQQFRLNTAHAKILSLILAFNGPTDLITGQKIDVAKALHYSNSREYHHFFPRDFLVGRGVAPRKANLLANFVMLTASSNKIITNRAPSDYLKSVEDQLGSSLDAALGANLISPAAYAAAKADEYDTFLVERSITIANKAAELAQWGA